MAQQQKIANPPPPAERRSAIAAALESAGDATHFVPSQDGYLELPVATVAASLLVYRVDNGRILSELGDAAEARGTTVNAFQARCDSDVVQQMLHALLLDQARDPAGPIYQELAQHRRQTEPLLIRRDGLVVNGNRRLAAMRELASREPARYSAFNRVRAAVLPADIEDEQLEYIEAALQMAPALKLEYSWINRRLKLRQHARDLSRERVMAAYRFTSVDEIDAELAELALAEEYLDWIGASGHYRRVAEHEPRFTELTRQLAGMGPPHLAELWKRAGFAMIRAEKRLEATIDHYFPFADPAPPAQRHWVMRSLAEDRGLVQHQPAGQNKPVEASLAARLQPLIDDPNRAESTAGAVMALIDALKGDSLRLLGTHRLLHHLRTARKTLEALEIDDIDPADLRPVRAEFAALDQHLRAFERNDPDQRPRSLSAGQRPWWPIRIARRAWRRLLGR